MINAKGHCTIKGHTGTACRTDQSRERAKLGSNDATHRSQPLKLGVELAGAVETAANYEWDQS